MQGEEGTAGSVVQPGQVPPAGAGHLSGGEPAVSSSSSIDPRKVQGLLLPKTAITLSSGWGAAVGGAGAAHACTHTESHACACTHAHIHMHATHTNTHAHIHMHPCMHNAHTCMHTHKHTPRFNSAFALGRSGAPFPSRAVLTPSPLCVSRRFLLKSRTLASSYSPRALTKARRTEPAVPAR